MAQVIFPSRPPWNDCEPSLFLATRLRGECSDSASPVAEPRRREFANSSLSPFSWGRACDDRRSVSSSSALLQMASVFSLLSVFLSARMELAAFGSLVLQVLALHHGADESFGAPRQICVTGLVPQWLSDDVARNLPPPSHVPLRPVGSLSLSRRTYGVAAQFRAPSCGIAFNIVRFRLLVASKMPTMSSFDETALMSPQCVSSPFDLSALTSVIGRLADVQVARLCLPLHPVLRVEDRCYSCVLCWC